MDKLKVLYGIVVVLIVALIGLVIYFDLKIKQIKKRMRTRMNGNVITMFNQLMQDPTIISNAKEGKSKEIAKVDVILKKAMDAGEDATPSCSEKVGELCKAAWNKVTYEKGNRVPPYKSEQLCSRDKNAIRCQEYFRNN